MVLYNKINLRHDKISFAIATVDAARSQEEEAEVDRNFALWLVGAAPTGYMWYCGWQEAQTLLLWLNVCVRASTNYNIHDAVHTIH